MTVWTKISRFVKDVLHGVPERLCPRTNRPPPPPQPQMPPPGIDGELRVDIAEAVPPAEQAPPQGALTDYLAQMRKWWFLFHGLCCAAAGLRSQGINIFETPPLSFHLFSMTLHFAVSALIVCNYIRTHYPSAALVMVHASIFSAVTAFTVVMAVNLPTSLMLLLVAVYFISILVIIFVNLYGPAT